MRPSCRAAALATTLVILGVPSTAAAAFPATECVLPSVGRGPGVGGSEWYTRIWVHNPGPTDASVTFALLLRDQSNTAPAEVQDTVASRAVGIYNDPVTNLFGASGFGALRIRSDQPVVVVARVYSEPPEGVAHSVGQLFAAIPTELAIGVGQTTTLLGGWQTNPVEDSYYRYNYGLVETAGGTATVEVRVYNFNGGERVRETRTVGPHEVRQWNLSHLLGDANAWAVYLELEVVAGDGRLVAFGSLIANRSNDPSTFEMQYADRLLSSVPARARPPEAGRAGSPSR
jgi:hypothetical protein